MVVINYAGRLGNNMLQYAAAKIFSDKFKIKLITPPVSDSVDFTSYINPNTNNEYYEYESQTIIVNNENFLNLLSKDEITKCKYVFSDFFQINEFVTHYENDIKKVFIDQTEKKPEVFLHYRIGDIENTPNMIRLEYYLDCLNRINLYNGVITSDSPNHRNVKIISEKFNLTIIEKTPLETIDLGRKYNNLILSEGTFSWFIGLLSNADNIFFNKRERFWHGDIFTSKKWIGLNYN
jgi:hypothetical protein